MARPQTGARSSAPPASSRNDKRSASERLAALPVIDRPCPYCTATPGHPCMSAGGHALMGAHARRLPYAQLQQRPALATDYEAAVIAHVFGGPVDDATRARCIKERTIDVRKSWVKKAIAARVDATARHELDTQTQHDAPAPETTGDVASPSHSAELAVGLEGVCECGCVRHGHEKLGRVTYGMSEATRWSTRGRCTMKSCKMPGGCSRYREFLPPPPAVVAQHGNGWRPMWSAPHDATDVEVFNGAHVLRAHWAEDLSGEEQPAYSGWFVEPKHGRAAGHRYDAVAPEPTHWRPLAAEEVRDAS